MRYVCVLLPTSILRVVLSSSGQSTDDTGTLAVGLVVVALELGVLVVLLGLVVLLSSGVAVVEGGTMVGEDDGTDDVVDDVPVDAAAGVGWESECSLPCLACMIFF
jgi:hypothetical protein